MSASAGEFYFHPEAETEFYEAIEFYEKRLSGLGDEFAAEVFSSIGRILEFPTSFSRVDVEIRRCLTHRFPYSILYLIEGTAIQIVAVMHFR